MKQSRYYKCTQCGHRVCRPGTPMPINWSNGHTCTFQEEDGPKKRKKTENTPKETKK